MANIISETSYLGVLMVVCMKQSINECRGAEGNWKRTLRPVDHCLGGQGNCGEATIAQQNAEASSGVR